MTKIDKKYFEAVGRRKTATARVRVFPGGSKTGITVNEKSSNDYFVTPALQKIVHDPVIETKIEDKLAITAIVSGGGIHSQAEAVRHGISRALVKMSEEQKIPLKQAGFLKRDPRSKERRKAGNAGKARKKKQWSKR